MASLIGGVVLGTVIGAAAGGNRGAAIGAGAGALAGGAACAVIAALDAQDKARIRQAQIEAASSSQPRYLSYNGSDGKSRTITVRPKPVPSGTQTAGRICRQTDGEASIQGTGQAELPPQLVCRTPGGDWLPA